jgi:hypothetical protein
MGHGTPVLIPVVAKFSSPPDLTSWKHLSQEGTSEQVFKFLETQNVHKVDLVQIAWRMQDRAFFDRALTILRSRFAFNVTLWSYSILHNVADALAEYLPHTYLAQRVGPYFRSSLLDVDAFEYQFNSYQHLEYSPLINARAHPLRSGNDSGDTGGMAAVKIQNQQFNAQYQSFLNYVLHRYVVIELFLCCKMAFIMCGDVVLIVYHP